MEMKSNEECEIERWTSERIKWWIEGMENWIADGLKMFYWNWMELEAECEKWIVNEKICLFKFEEWLKGRREWTDRSWMETRLKIGK
jgi:hypothetical protein